MITMISGDTFQSRFSAVRNVKFPLFFRRSLSRLGTAPFVFRRNGCTGNSQVLMVTGDSYTEAMKCGEESLTARGKSPGKVRFLT